MLTHAVSSGMSQSRQSSSADASRRSSMHRWWACRTPAASPRRRAPPRYVRTGRGPGPARRRGAGAPRFARLAASRCSVMRQALDGLLHAGRGTRGRVPASSRVRCRLPARPCAAGDDGLAGRRRSWCGSSPIVSWPRRRCRFSSSASVCVRSGFSRNSSMPASRQRARCSALTSAVSATMKARVAGPLLPPDRRGRRQTVHVRHLAIHQDQLVGAGRGGGHRIALRR